MLGRCGCCHCATKTFLSLRVSQIIRLYFFCIHSGYTIHVTTGCTNSHRWGVGRTVNVMYLTVVIFSNGFSIFMQFCCQSSFDASQCLPIFSDLDGSADQRMVVLQL